MDFGGTGGAVFRPVGARAKQALTLGAYFHAALGKQRRIQYTVQGQHSSAEPFADQRVGDTLWADTFLAIVQQQTVPAIIITAAMYQPAGRPVLLVVHVDNHGSFSPAGSLM